METYPNRNKYSNDFLREVRGTLLENFKEIGQLNRKDFEHKIDNFHFEVQTNQSFLGI